MRDACNTECIALILNFQKRGRIFCNIGPKKISTFFREWLRRWDITTDHKKIPSKLCAQHLLTPENTYNTIQLDGIF